MNHLPAQMKKAFKIMAREGVPLLLEGILKRIRHRIRQRAADHIDRIAALNIPNSEKFSLIYQKQLWLKAVPSARKSRVFP